MRIRSRWLIGAAALLAAVGGALVGELAAPSSGARAETSKPAPPRHLTARRLRPRPGAAARGKVLANGDLFPDRVFANAHVGFALANYGSAQYPARTTDGGRVWRIDGPQVHIDAADGAEGVGYVGVAGPRTFFAYGSSAVDVTTDGGRTWRETFLGELVTAVVAGTPNDLVAYVQQSVSNNRPNPAVTWQYVSRDGGRHWRYNRDLGGGVIG